MPSPPPTLREAASAPPDTSFADLAKRAAMDLLAGHVDPTDAKRVAEAAFTFPVPLVEIAPGVHMLELFHGPTHAFKDFGARFMARLMGVLDSAGPIPPPPRTVLVATSGDTGGAVASAFLGMEGYRVLALFPGEGVSARQRRQMTTLGDNITAVAVDGSFDDCQRLAKEAFGDRALREAHGLTSANSINIGRLLPQAIYYIYAAHHLGSAPRFVVPSGNLGNLCSGLMAHAAGMPAHEFISASNVNDAFPVFLATGEAPDRDSVATVSNAMDVGRPSNLERIRWMFRGEPRRLNDLVTGVVVTDDETRACIRAVYEGTGYVLDPHAAVAYRAHERHPAPTDVPTVILATAHPAKFPDVVERAIGRPVPLPEGLAAVADKPEVYQRAAPRLAELETILNESQTIA